MSKISELSDGGALQSTDYLIAVRSGGNVKVRPNGSLTLGTLTLDGLTVDTNTLHVDATNNRVGIGTSSPSESLETTGNIQIKYAGVNTDPSGARYLYFNNTDTTLVAGQPLGGISWVNNDSSATAGEAAYVKAYASNNTGNTELRFGTGGQNAAAEAMRLDASGNLLVGKSSADNTTAGTTIYGSVGPGAASFVRDSGNTLILNRLTNDGEILAFRKDGTTVGSITTISDGLGIGSGDTGLYFESVSNEIRPFNTTSNASIDAAIDLGNSTKRFKDLYLSGGVISSNGSIYIGRTDLNTSLWIGNSTINPGDGSGSGRDNAIDLGFSSVRFDDIYATNALIQTSDRNEKQDIEELSEAERRVAVAAKGLLRKFRWISSVEEKGDDARIHFGIIAQDLQAAFEAEGLDAGRYAMFIHSTWTDEETGEERSRMGVRYSELLAFIIAAL